MKIKTSIRHYNKKPVRAVFNDPSSSWYYSANDLVDAFVDTNNPRRYWSDFKRRHNEINKYIKTYKLTSKDNKQYLTDVLNNEGVDIFINLLSNKYTKELIKWLKELNNPLDERSKVKAYELFDSGTIDNIEVGTTKGLQQIHSYIFEGLYDFAGKIRTKSISKDNFMFADPRFLNQTLKEIDNMPSNTIDEIIDKYIEMNIAHPFMEGNGRATRIWLDLMLKNRVHKCVDWSKIDKKEYLDVMKKSVTNSKPITKLLRESLTSKIQDRSIYMKGIDYSYYYEEV